VEKAKSEPGRAYFVGRRAELEFFYNRMLAAVQKKQSQIVTLNGPAGIGKSRLLDELTQRLEAGGRPLRSYRYAMATSGAPPVLQQILCQRFSLDSDDSPEFQMEQIRSGVSEIIGEDRLDDAMRFIATAAGVTIGSNGRPFEGMAPDLISHPRFQVRAQTTAFNLLRYDAARTPHLWIFEDWDRAERSSDHDVVSTLLQRLDGRMSCALISTRSPLNLAELEVSHFNLEPLSMAHSAQLIEGCVENVDSLPNSFVADTARQCAGNPRLALELVRLFRSKNMLKVDETGEWRFRHEDYAPQAIPGDIHTTVRQRVQELAPYDCLVLQRVLRFGEVAWLDGLVSLFRALEHDRPPTDEGDSVRREVVDAVEELLDEGQLESTDNHLFRGVRAVRLASGEWHDALPEVDEHTKRQEHAVIAQWLMAANAREPARARQLAIHHWLEAGRHDRAVDMVINWLSIAVGAELDDAVKMAKRTLEGLGPADSVSKVALLRPLAMRALMTQRPDNAVALLDRLAHEVAVLDDARGHASTLLMRGECGLISGRLDEAIAYLDRARMAWETLECRQGRADTLERKAAALAFRGGTDALDAATKLLERVVTLRRELGGDKALSATLVRLAEFWVQAGNLTKARGALNEALQLTKNGAPLVHARAHSALAQLHWEAGEPDQAEVHWDKAMRLAHEGGDVVGVARVRLSKAEPLVAAGRASEAREEADAVASLARDLGRRDLEARALALASRAALAASDADTAAELANTSLETAQAIGRQLEVARALLSRAQVGANALFDASAAAEKRAGQAHDDFTKASSLLDEMGERPLLIKVLHAFGQHLVERGSIAQGQRQMDRARELRLTLRSDAAEERAFHAAQTIRRTYHTSPVAIGELEVALENSEY
jgi:hypothetical protein